MRVQLWRVSLCALLTVFAACSGGSDDGNASDASDAAGSTATHPASNSSAEPGSLAATVDEIVTLAGKLSREEFDSQALAAKLGKDPQAHLDWVRGNTAWAPYRGLLRGSKGVMVDRVGSNLDRAVLLGGLLRHSGYTVRLVHAQLPEDRALELLKGMESKSLRSSVEDDANSSNVARDARELVRTQSGQLLAAIGGGASGKATSRGDAVLAMRDHWWVELQNDARWIALDVLLPDTGPESVHAHASNRIEWLPTDSMPSIPEDDWHSVSIRVVVESYASGVTKESTVLETTLKPAIVVDRPITLEHIPAQWPSVTPDPKADPNALGNFAVNVREWVPVLRVGDQSISQSGFNDAGEVVANPLSAARDINETGGGSVFGGFDDALSGSSAANSHLTAEWLVYEIRVPGAKSEWLRRPLFDLLGPANRNSRAAELDPTTNERLVTRSESLLGRTDILLQPCGFTGEFVVNLASAAIVARQAELRALSRETNRDKAAQLAVDIVSSLDFWGPLPGYVRWRSLLVKDSGESFIDRPNILNYRLIPAVVSADVVPARSQLDVVSNSIGVHGDVSRGDFEIRLEQGVADTVAEIVTVGGDLREAENTASIFARTNALAGEFTLLDPGNAAKARKLELPVDTVERIASTLGEGFVVVVPSEAVKIRDRLRIGWWRVDPASGATIGVMDTGFHGVDEDIKLRDAVDMQRRNLLYLKVRHAPGHYGRNPYYRSVEEREMWRQVDTLIDQLNELLMYFPPM